MQQQANTWIDILGEVAAGSPDKVGFSYLPDAGGPPADLTYGAFDRRARAVAVGLVTDGLAPGDRAVLWYPSGLDYLAAFFGCLYAGIIPVPAYPPSPRRLDRVLGILADCEPRAILSTAAVRAKMLAAGLPDGLVDQLPPVTATDEIDPALAGAWQRPDVTGDSVAFLQYTSGSTASPRGVVLTHDNLVANSALTHRLFGTSDATSAVSWLPMYHDMGLIGAILQTVYTGGSCLLMSPASFAKDPVGWLRAISDSRADASGGPNFAYDLCVDRVTDADRSTLDLNRWRLAFNGAEPVRPQTLERFVETFGPCGFRAEAFTPCYGLAEATLMVTSKPLGSKVTVAGKMVGAGVVPEGVEVAIVDPASRERRPAGVEGEIWVAGPSIGKGYWQRPEQSRETFRAALADGSGPKFLRTGDLGYVDGGELFVTGRHKDLVIVRGRNHYPQDIEQTVERCDPVLRRNGGAAFAAPRAGGVEGLVVVHEIAREHDGVDLSELTAGVAAAVAAEHDVLPDAVVLIRAGSLPRTSSGKVQRHRCREAFLAGRLDVVSGPSTLDTQWTDPTSEIVATLRVEVARLVGVPVDRVDPQRPLTSVGLDSVAAAALAHRAEVAFGRAVSAEEALSGSLVELATLVAARPLSIAGAEPAPADNTGDHPLSHTQRPLWMLQRLIPDAPAHIIAAAAWVPDGLDVDALRRAVGWIVARHDALRTTFPVVHDEPVQRVHRELPPLVDVVDATGMSEANRVERRELAASAPFDVAAGPLLRVTVLRCADGDEIVVAVHHLVADLWSMDVLLGELDVAYPAAVAGGDMPATPIPAGYPDLAARRATELADRTDPLWTHWSRQLAGAPTILPLPTLPDAGPRRLRCAAVPFELDQATTGRLAALARTGGTTLFGVLLAGLQAYLAGRTGRRDILVGAPTHGRHGEAEAGTVGLFANMVVLRGTVDPGAPGTALLASAADTVRSALEHADLPFDTVVERTKPVRDPSRSPLIQAVLTLHRAASEQREAVAALALGVPGIMGRLGGLTIESLPLRSVGAPFDLVLTVAEVAGRLTGRLVYDADLFAIDEMRAATDGVTRILTELASDPSRTVAELSGLFQGPAGSTVDPESGGVPSRPLRHVDELFAEQVAIAPERPALVCGDRTMTYRELDDEVSALAGRLRHAGVGPEAVVAVLLDRSPELVVALLAIIRAGGAYLPLDPAYPEQRLAFVLDDAAPALVVTRTALAGRLPETAAPVLNLDSPAEARPYLDRTPHDLDRLAYIIYTSGSTGRPKGVLIDHRALANLFAGTSDSYRFDHTDVWTLFHSYAFDFSVWEIWGALAHGGTLVVVPAPVTLTPADVWDLVERHGVTVLNQTPAVFRELTGAAPERLGRLGLRHIIFGGEKLEQAHLAAWRRHGNPATRVTNMYGITEITVHATYGPLGPSASAAVVPLGVPLPGTELFLLDPDGQPVGPEETGEICIGGAGVARGYLNRPSLTATKFTPNPTRPGGRLYRSGDLGRRTVDGTLEYLGRADDQVKIRGFRIEPAEVAAAVAEAPSVRDAFVHAVDDPRVGARLLAYVVPVDPNQPPDPAALRTWSRSRLPDHLVPSSFVVLGTLPLTVNGKVDRTALPVPEPMAAGGAELVGDTERTVGSFVAEMLEVPSIGRDDDLFDHGWHSLLMARLALRIRDSFGIEPPLAELFLRPTIEHIATLIDAAPAAAPEHTPAKAIALLDRSRYAARPDTSDPFIAAAAARVMRAHT